MVGIAGAYFCAKRDFPLKKLLLSFASVPLCIPALLAALGYVGAFGMQGILNRTLVFLFDFRIRFLYSFSGVVFVQGFYNFPIIMKNVSDSWKSISSEKEDAARLLGTGKARIFFSITIFDLLPSICSSSIIVFLFCFFSFLIILLFGPANFSTLEVELYLRAQNLSEPQKAALIAATETLIALVFVTLFALIERRSEKNRGTMQEKNEAEPISKSSVNEKICFALFVIVVFVGFVLPFLMIFHNAFLSKLSQRGTLSSGKFSFGNFIWLFKRRTFLSSLQNTFSVGLRTSFFSCLIGFILSLVFFKSKNRFASKIFSFIPMSISTVVTGFLFLVIFRRGSVNLLVFAEVFLYWPYAFRQILNSMEKIPYEIQEASLVFCRSRFLRIVTIYAPLAKNAFFSSFFFCFALSAGDASLPLVLGIPRFSNIALDTYRLASAYRFNEACASGVLLFIMTTVLYAASTFFERRKFRGG